MNNKAKYKEPAIPDGRIEFTRALIEITQLPLDVFLRANDGRKFLVKCRNRQFLLQKLASFADPDGTSCYPSASRLLDETKFSNGTLNAYLKDLESDELGFVAKGGYAWEDGPRVRRLTLPTGEKAGLQDSKQDSSIPNSGLQDSTSGFQYSKSRIPVQTGNNLPVVDLPEKNLPPQDLNAAGGGFVSNSNPNPTDKEKIKESVRLIRKTFREHFEETEQMGVFTLTVKEAESLFVGRDPDMVDQALCCYLSERNWRGLTIRPQKILLDEFPDAYEDHLEFVAKQEKKWAEQKEVERQLAEMNVKAKENYEKLHGKREELSQAVPVSVAAAVPVSDPADPDVIKKVYCCYDLNLGNEEIAKRTGITVDEVREIVEGLTADVAEIQDEEQDLPFYNTAGEALF